jgi:hypothetical protein
MTEPENVERVIQMLSKDFACVVEDIDNNNRILGTHPSGKNLFIDALIRPKSDGIWRNGKKTIFGIEFKRDHDNYRDLTKHIAQSVDYSYSSWQYGSKHIGRIPILMFPRPVFERKKNYTKTDIDFFVPRFLGQFNVGFIEESFDFNHDTLDFIPYITIKMSDTLLWSSKWGASNMVKSYKFEHKVGSR